MIEDRNMKRVLIESPYAGDIDRNITYAKLAIRDSLNRGEAPYASHLFFTQPGILNDMNPQERQLGIEAGLIWGSVADLVAVYKDLGISSGMSYGIERAKQRNQPITFRSLNLFVGEIK